ncbi:MAG: hypothetical protein DRO67_10500, partial [Candidatus Asgardarchaeum californiense]
SKTEKKEYRKVKTIASQYVDEYDGTPAVRNVRNDLGVCSDCENLEYAETKWGRYFAKCGHMEFKLNANDPIQKCNKHTPVGKMELSDMWNIYIPIELNKKTAGLLT